MQWLRYVYRSEWLKCLSSGGFSSFLVGAVVAKWLEKQAYDWTVQPQARKSTFGWTLKNNRLHLLYQDHCGYLEQGP